MKVICRTMCAALFAAGLCGLTMASACPPATSTNAQVVTPAQCSGAQQVALTAVSEKTECSAAASQCSSAQPVALAAVSECASTKAACPSQAAVKALLAALSQTDCCEGDCGATKALHAALTTSTAQPVAQVISTTQSTCSGATPVAQVVNATPAECSAATATCSSATPVAQVVSATTSECSAATATCSQSAQPVALGATSDAECASSCSKPAAGNPALQVITTTECSSGAAATCSQSAQPVAMSAVSDSQCASACSAAAPVAQVVAAPAGECSAAAAATCTQATQPVALTAVADSECAAACSTPASKATLIATTAQQAEPTGCPVGKATQDYLAALAKVQGAETVNADVIKMALEALKMAAEQTLAAPAAVSQVTTTASQCCSATPAATTVNLGAVAEECSTERCESEHDCCMAETTTSGVK